MWRVCERFDDTVASIRAPYGDAAQNPNRTLWQHNHMSLLPLQDVDESGDDGGSGVGGCSRVI